MSFHLLQLRDFVLDKRNTPSHPKTLHFYPIIKSRSQSAQITATNGIQVERTRIDLLATSRPELREQLILGRLGERQHTEAEVCPSVVRMASSLFWVWHPEYAYGRPVGRAICVLKSAKRSGYGRSVPLPVATGAISHFQMSCILMYLLCDFELERQYIREPNTCLSFSDNILRLRLDPQKVDSQ